MKQEKDNIAYQKGYSDGFREGQTAGLKLAEKAIHLGTQVKMEMKGEIGNIAGKKVLVSRFVPGDTVIFGKGEKIICPFCKKEKTSESVICKCEVENTGMDEFWKD